MAQVKQIALVMVSLWMSAIPLHGAAQEVDEQEGPPGGGDLEGPPRQDVEEVPPEDATPLPPAFQPQLPPSVSSNTETAPSETTEGERRSEGDGGAMTGSDTAFDSESGEGTPAADRLDGSETGPNVTVPDDASSSRVMYGRLEIDTEPQGADISLSAVGGTVVRAVGATPLPIRLPEDSYRVVLEKPGYETAVAEVSVEAGRVARLKVRLEPERSGAARGVRIAGHALFWPGLATSVTGIVLLVVDNPKENINTGKAGFATAGVGVAMTVLGGIFLGVTHRDRSVYTIPPVAVGTTPDGGGPAISFRKSF